MVELRTKMAVNVDLQAMADLEIDMMSDMYKRMSDTCKEKCIATNYREGELTKGEAVCLDRCIAKYLKVHEDLGQKLTQMSSKDEVQTQKMQHEQTVSTK